MELQNNIFDEFKAAADGEEEVPFKEPLWERIASRLDEEPKKRPAFVPWVKYLAASVVLLVGSGIVWQLSLEENKTPSTELAQHTEQEQPADVPLADVDTQKTVSETPPTKSMALAVEKNPKPERHTGSNKQRSFNIKVSDSITVLAQNKVHTERPGNKPFLYNNVVIDEHMDAVAGAVVQLKGSAETTLTDNDGTFTMQLPDSNVTLIVSATGTAQKEIPLRQLSSKWITLKNDPATLNEVVVYGAKLDHRSYVGASSTVTAKEISNRPVSSIAAAINGAAPGVLVTSGGGQPGSNPDIMLRGMGSISPSAPLIVLDGAPYSGALNSISPNDIKDMVILKDATTTAIYGARAANGTILITTKRGEKANLQDGIPIYHMVNRKNKRKIDKKPVEQAQPAKAEEPQLKEEPAHNEETYERFEENKFESPLNQPLSTFSIDVDKASYSNIRRFINSGTKVPKDAVRIEEMINYFSYTYPQPEAGKPFSINTEYSDAPWNPQHRLLKIGLQGRIIPQDKIPPSNLVFLIDVSGSMNAPDKLPYVQQSMAMLTRQLRKEDHVAIVVYAGAAGLVLPATSGDQKEKIMEAINRLSAGGSTAGGAGIELAYKVAKEHFIPNGNNRIILATDGDFNVGASDDRSMQELIEEKRKDNIYLTCLGFGMGNYKDSKMELLADKGNGNYAYIDQLAEAKKTLQQEFGSTMFTIAKDVKIQVEFNPALVQSYRLIGYENRKLNAEDFANDAIDAGELGSGHTVTALYEIIPKGAASPYAVDGTDRRYTAVKADSTFVHTDELARIQFRYKEPNEDNSKLITQLVKNNTVPANQASRDFRRAASVAWFGLQLRDSKLVPDKSLNHIASYAKEAIDRKKKEEIELITLIEAAK